MRETEKSQFYNAIDYMDRMEAIKQLSKKKQTQANTEFLRSQMAEKARRKEIDHAVETLYYKPHFGPEETLDQVQVKLDKEKQKQEFLKMNLTHQINAQRELSEASRQHERHADQKFLKAQADAQNLEHAALRKKDQLMK